jgi:phage terminase large subunit
MKIDFTNYYSLLNPIYWDMFESKKRCRIFLGGASSGKSYFVFQDVIYKILAEPGHNYLVCRKIAASSRISTYAQIKQTINELGLSKIFQDNKSDLSFTIKSTGHMIICKGLDDVEKIKSITFPTGVLTDIIIEEASEILQKDFDQLNIRLRGKAKVPFQITLMLNPIIDTHWIKREFFDLKSYQKYMTVDIVHSTYLDNNFLDDDTKEILEGYKNVDPEFYKVYCLGQWGSYGNVIFNNWEFSEFTYEEKDFDSIYIGMDFGFNHPFVIEKVGFKDGSLYSYDELCLKEKTNIECIETNKEYDILKIGQKCVADSAEPARIKEWIQQGYGVVPAKKGKGSVSRGIDYLKSLKWIIDPNRCPRLAQEIQTYHYKKDKNDNKTDDPVDVDDDSIKSIMYALESLSEMKGKPSILSGKLSPIKKQILEIKKAERKNMREVIKAQMKKKREGKNEKRIR